VEPSYYRKELSEIYKGEIENREKIIQSLHAFVILLACKSQTFTALLSAHLKCYYNYQVINVTTQKINHKKEIHSFIKKAQLKRISVCLDSSNHIIDSFHVGPFV